MFTVQHQNGSMEVTAEEVLVSLLFKVGSIVEGHSLHLSKAYIAVPTHHSQAARHSLKQAAEVALGKPTRLIDEWIPLAVHYVSPRLK